MSDTIQVVRQVPLHSTIHKLDKNPKQVEAINMIARNRHNLLEGGGRSGKTMIICYVIVIRALSMRSDHLICRFRFSHAKRAICFQTMPKLLRILGLTRRVKLNRTEWFYEFPNGSTIWIGGLDEKERTEKILGNEYATIAPNEGSQISYDSRELLLTRLNPPEGMRGLELIDYNPPSIEHWGYKIFHKRVFPDGRAVPDNDYAWIKINPIDNKHNSKEYMDILAGLSEAKRRRFMDGEYSLDAGKLWKRAFFKYWTDEKSPVSKDLPEFMRVVVAVDPAGTEEGDEIGIVVSGNFMFEGEENFMTLDDATLHGTPEEWAKEVAAMYEKWKADVIVAESNYGGQMVESVIRNTRRGLPVKLVNSSRGKLLRAEPVSLLYEQGKWWHRIPFMALEDECCMYDPATSKSPNRMDALVFSGTELAGDGLTMLDVV